LSFFIFFCSNYTKGTWISLYFFSFFFFCWSKHPATTYDWGISRSRTR